MSDWHLAGIWETIADAIPDAPAVAQSGRRSTWRQYDERAARIAGALTSAGIMRGAKLGIYGYNSCEYLDVQFGAFKVGAVPVNVNYRYTAHELIYLLDNADAEALAFDAQFGSRVKAILGELPNLKLLIEIDDGSGRHLEQAIPLEKLVAGSPRLQRGAHNPDDIYMIYTGGTTGMPKGVMYRQGDFAAALMGGFNMRAVPGPTSYAELALAVAKIQREGTAPISIPACPLMHSVGMGSGVFIPQTIGGSAFLFRNERFDADSLLALIASERATDLAIVGDSFAKPILAALDRAIRANHPYDLSSLQRVFSSGAMLSRESKEALLAHADIVITDLMGSTEGSLGLSMVSRASPPLATARFTRNPTTKVFDANDREVRPGSGDIGLLATSGLTPFGYYKDEKKGAETFRTINGVRYSIPGDFARVEADGSLTLLGRGSSCINTGGEKVFPEEVEEAIKSHADVYDCVVIGVPDDRFGERVVAIVSCTEKGKLDESSVIDFARERVAGYKTPRRIVIVDTVSRLPNGKPDHKWAKSIALGEVGAP